MLVMSQKATVLRADSEHPVEAITARFGQQLGTMRLASTRHVYPLVGVLPHHLVARRFAAVGDAAVGMHPVTAHGFNFGLLGQDALASAIRKESKCARLLLPRLWH